MTEIRVTKTDLRWWTEFAASREWTFAKTYARSAPHDYVVAGRTPNVAHEDLVRAARVIHTFGTPGKYYSVTKIYLVSPDGRHRWWTEDDDLRDTNLVNRATAKVFYGIQNAQSTFSGISSTYDEVATTWDVHHSSGPSNVEDLRTVLAGVRGKYPPHVLDLGCGTGRVLDLGLASPERYAGVDFSQAMLNMLVRKHPKVAAVYASDVRDALAKGMFTPSQFDWVFIDAAMELTTEQITQAENLARLAVVHIDRNEWSVQAVRSASSPTTPVLSKS